MDSFGLKYADMNALVIASDITEGQKKKLAQNKLDANYETMRKLIKEAERHRGDLEEQHIYYMRAGTVARMIMDSMKFDTWPKHEKTMFHSDMSRCVEQLNSVRAILNKKYEQRQIRQSQIDKENEKKEGKKKSSGGGTTDLFHEIRKQIRPLITPRELIKKVEDETPKKSAMIFDFRADQTNLIDWKRSEMITVIQVPNHLIDSSLTFNSLKNILPVTQRALLPRLSGCDYVVLMDDGSPELFNGNVVQGHKSFFLYKAFTAYMTSEIRLKERPLFMEGGFASWKNHYPGYTTLVQPGSARSAPSDDLDNAILKYLPKSELAHMKYPDVMPALTIVDEPKPHIPPRPAMISPPAPTHLIAPEPPARPGFGVAFPPTVPHMPAAGSTYERPERPGAPIFGAPTTTTNITPGPSAPPKPTLPDRTSKPTFLERPADPSSNHQQHREARQNGGGELKRPPLLDRSAKPLGHTISSEAENTLLTFYALMSENLAKASRRAGSASSRQGATGLFNMGNTCFMSATLQCLFQTPGLAEMFTKKTFISHINAKNTMGTKGAFSAGFAALCDLVWAGDFEAIKPARFLQYFATMVTDYLSDGRQHDASEFQLFLLDTLHEDTNMAPRGPPFEQNYKGGQSIREEFQVFLPKHRLLTNSALNRLFGTMSVSVIKCGTCGETSATFEESTQITVELTSNTSCSLESCLESHYSSSSLDGDSKWMCPNCKALRDSKRTVRLWTLPPVLIIHLKRFSLWNGEFEKNQAAVTFDPNHFDARAHMHEMSPDTRTKYRLYATTIHSGRLNSGHYTAVASNLKTGKWHRYDDETVRPMDGYSVDPSLVYILFYKRC